ncbi:4Fe-4S dicluster domain-containing protein [Candidatus Acetothermia bacterium]|nr:4Fe-4S dicluster domain-containing protein [Candidatus Acetothermia bacterium]MCI2431182.1 4Fe-4S dicluster domain-containing protein [Candidatus Acetothermia bacterium]MCI2437259.1 4Fe-4S dicluster domain-containing protein [Candidatus Acetothermia bacterium]
MANPISRRCFLAGLVVGACSSGRLLEGRAAEQTVGMLYDVTRCIGCGLCERACEEQNQLPEGRAYVDVLRAENGRERCLRRACMHCLDPACVSACPVGALQKTPQGPVIYRRELCIGCRYCMVACPLGIPRLNWEENSPYIQKCQMCADRIAQGEPPACVSACPTGALQFGLRAELLKCAKERLAEEKLYLFGEHELGGTSVLYLSDVPFADLGLHCQRQEPLPKFTAGMLQKVPWVVGALALGLSGLYFMRRRQKSGEDEDKDKD